MKVIGLGRVGMTWAKHYDPKAVLIDSEKGSGVCQWPRPEKPEDYEEIVPKKITKLLSSAKGPILLFVSSENDLSLASLIVLEIVRGQEIFVVFIRPNENALKDFRIFQRHVLISGVFAEYARSGAFSQLIVYDTPVDPESSLEAFSWFLKEYLYRKEQVPSYGTVAQLIPEAKIVTLSLFDDEMNERTYAILPKVREKTYFYVLPTPEQTVVLRSVVDFFTAESKKYEKSSYGIFFSKEITQPTIYAVEKTSEVRLDLPVET